MPLFALSPETSDFLTIWGFVVTVAGTLVGVVGFGYTIHQVRKVQAAAEAAEAAAKKVLAESKHAFTRFVGTNASRLLSELQRAVNNQEWKLAEIRANDLAEILGSLPGSRDRITGMVAKLREHAQKFAVRTAESTARFQHKKWAELLSELHALLDELRTPFPEEKHGEAATDTAGRDVPRTRPEPPQPNAGEGSQLGEG